MFEGKSSANSLCFTPDGTRLLAARYPHAVDIWTLATGRREQLLKPDSNSRTGWLVLHPYGVLRFGMVYWTSVVSLSDRKNRRIPDVPDALEVAVSRHADRAIVGMNPGGYWLKCYRCGPNLHFGGEPLWEQQQSKFDFETAYVFLGDNQILTCCGRTFFVRDAVTGEVRHTIAYPSDHHYSWAAAPDGGRFAVMGGDRLYLWDTTTWGKPTRVPGFVQKITAMAYHPTRPILATIQGGQTLVKFLDADSGTPLAKFQWKLGEMRSVCFSPDGTLAAAGAANGKIVVWDVDE